MEELVKYMKAIVALQIHQLEQKEGKKPTRPDVALARAGLSYKEVGALLGCSENAVKKAVQRAKNAQPSNDQPEGNP